MVGINFSAYSAAARPKFGSLKKVEEIAQKTEAEKQAKEKEEALANISEETLKMFEEKEDELFDILDFDIIETPHGNLTGYDLLLTIKEKDEPVNPGRYLNDLLPDVQEQVTAAVQKLIDADLLKDYAGWGHHFTLTELGKYCVLADPFNDML